MNSILFRLRQRYEHWKWFNHFGETGDFHISRFFFRAYFWYETREDRAARKELIDSLYPDDEITITIVDEKITIATVDEKGVDQS